MKKIVFFDLDGTLLTTQKEILEENKKAIKLARENDIEICICSGRPQSAVRKYQKMAGAGRYIISANGAEIYDTEAEEQLYACALEEDFCVKLYEHAVKNNLFMRIDTKYGRFINIERYKVLDDIVMTETDYKKFFREEKILQFSFGSMDSKLIEEIVEIVNKSGIYSIANRFMSGMLPDKLDIINIVNSSVSKGNAILGLCKYLKIDPKDTIGFGDDYNDVSMMKSVGHGVAMGNAFDEIKALASEVTLTNDEPGIAEFLNRLVIENQD